MPKNKRYSIQLLPAARQDLYEIVTFIATDKPLAALKYLDKIHSKIKLLSTHPFIGSLPRDPHLKERKYRILVVDSYLVFYVVQKKIVKVRRIIHGSREIRSIVGL